MSSGVLVLLPLLAACATAPIVPPPPPPKPPPLAPKTIFVASDGNDAIGLGTKEAPYKSIARALKVEAATDSAIAKGEYAEKELVLSRKISLAGPADGGATFVGRLVIRGDEAQVHHLDVTGGIVIERAQQVVIDAG